MQDIDLLFEQLTVESYRRFLKINPIEGVKLNLKKQELANEVKQYYYSDQEFQKSFVAYVKEVEIAGRKDFWIFHSNEKLSPSSVSTLRNQVKNIPEEGDTIFTPPEVDQPKYFRIKSDGNSLKFKVIRRKIVREGDPLNDRIEEGRVYKAYINVEKRHVCYYDLNLSTGILICGIDTWKSLHVNEKLAILNSDLEMIFEKSHVASLVKYDIVKKSKNFFDAPHVLTKSLSTKPDAITDQGAIFLIKADRITQIKKELNGGKLLLKDIKTKNFDTDVKDNEVLKLTAKQSLPMTTESGTGVYFYYDDSLEQFEYIRFELYSVDSRIRFLNDHLTMTDLKNVFSEII